MSNEKRRTPNWKHFIIIVLYFRSKLLFRYRIHGFFSDRQASHRSVALSDARFPRAHAHGGERRTGRRGLLFDSNYSYSHNTVGQHNKIGKFKKIMKKCILERSPLDSVFFQRVVPHTRESRVEGRTYEPRICFIQGMKYRTNIC